MNIYLIFLHLIRHSLVTYNILKKRLNVGNQTIGRHKKIMTKYLNLGDLGECQLEYIQDNAVMHILFYQ